MTGPVDLLYQFSPRPHMVVTTGTCCANRGEAQLGDMCVVRSGNQQLSLFAELEHMLEVWRLESGGSLVPKELKPPRSMYQQMVCLARIYAELEVKRPTYKDFDFFFFNFSCQRLREVRGSRGWNWMSRNLLVPTPV